MADLRQDLASADYIHGVEQGFWRIVDQLGSVLYFELFAPDGMVYVLELGCAFYGIDALQGRFVDRPRGVCVCSAWPRGNATFNQWIKFADVEPFICWDQDRVGIQHHQQDWANRKAWQKSKNQLVTYLDFLRALLHVEAKGYARRRRETDS
ncbi:MAG TPA: hypothetical protein VI756_09895 [Blastocatellia bacterium]